MSQQGFEPIQGYLARTRDELQKGSPLLLRKLVQSRPEPPHLRGTLGVPMLLDVSLEVFEVKVRQARDHLLQLAEVEDLEQPVRDQQIEPFEERLDLPLDALAQPLLADFLHLVRLVRICHHHVAAIRDQVLDLRASELVNFDRECQVNNTNYRIFQYPLESVIILLVHIFVVL